MIFISSILILTRSESCLKQTYKLLVFFEYLSRYFFKFLVQIEMTSSSDLKLVIAR